MPVAYKPLPPRDAIAALEARGMRLDPSFRWQDRYAEDHARAFTVARSAGFDVLTEIYAGLDAALKEGRTHRQFADELTPLLQAKGWWGRQMVTDPGTGLPTSAQLGSPRRLALIFDVNMRVSYAAGHWASFERNRRVRPFLRYVHLEGQEHPRLHHQAWHNLVLPIDHEFWKTHACPNGWNCHCTLQSLSERDIDALRADGEELKFEAPPIETLPWTNKVTGEVRHIPKGIDPGWDYNPGKAGYRGVVNTAFAVKVAAAPAPLRDAAIAERLASTEFQQFYANPAGAMPVMQLADDVASAIGATPAARAVALSADTMRKQLQRHGELAIADYQLLPEVAQKAVLVLQDGERSVILIAFAGGRWRYVVVKSTASGEGLFMQSYRVQPFGRIAALLARPDIRVLVDRRSDQ